MKYVAFLLVIFSLASCAKKDKFTIIKPEDFPPLQKAIHKESFVRGFSKQEIETCFRDKAVKNKFGVTIYPLLNIKKPKRKYCHVAFGPKLQKGRYRISARSYDNYSAEACEMLALKCLNPEGYRRIKAKFELKE